MGIGEAISPTSANPWFGMEPGDVPFDMKVDPTKLTAEPFKGFMAGPENIEAKQRSLTSDKALKNDQIRRGQVSSEQIAEEARKRELIKQAGTIALLDYKNATGLRDPIPMSAADPYVQDALFGSRGRVEGYTGSGPRLAATMGRMPHEEAIAAAEAGRQRHEAEVGMVAAENNTPAIADAYVAGLRKSVIANEGASLENDTLRAKLPTAGYYPLHEGTTLTPTGAIVQDPVSKGGFQQSGTDASGQPAFSFVPASTPIPRQAIRTGSGRFFFPDGPAKAPAAPAAGTPAPVSTPGGGPGIFAPPLTLTPSAFNPDPIQARGAIPNLLNNSSAYLNRLGIEGDTLRETESQVPFSEEYLRDFRNFYWQPPTGPIPEPTINHPALSLPPEIEAAKRKRRAGLAPMLAPAYSPAMPSFYR